MRARIVAIDDDPRLLRRVQQSLDERGYAAVTSTDWNRACELIAQLQPQLVIIDSPTTREWQGWKALDALKRDAVGQAIPVIMYSNAARALAPDARVLREFQVLVLPQPVDLDDLPRRVSDLLGMHLQSTGSGTQVAR